MVLGTWGSVACIGQAAAQSLPAITNHRLQIGVFSGGYNPANAAAFETWAGQPSAYNVDFFSRIGFTGYNNIVDSAGYIVSVWRNAARPGRNMLFSVPLTTDVDKSLAHVAAGNYDSQYTAIAMKVAQAYPSAIIRLGWEFNGGWYPWAAKNHTADYIAAFRHVATIFKAVSGTFTIDWCVAMGYQQFPAEMAYPGNDVVDVIGIDVYNDGNFPKIADPVKRWVKLRDQDHGLTWHANYANGHKKPLSFPEWASGKGADDDPYFMQQFYAWMTTHNVAYASYWNSNSDFQGELSHNQYPQAASSYLQTFALYKPIAPPSPPEIMPLHQ